MNQAVNANADQQAATRVDFRTDPSRYKHWKLTFDGPVGEASALLTGLTDPDPAERPGPRDGAG